MSASHPIFTPGQDGYVALHLSTEAAGRLVAAGLVYNSGTMDESNFVLTSAAMEGDHLARHALDVIQQEEG